MPGVGLRRWRNQRSTTPGIYPAAVRAEADLIRGEAALRVALALRAEGFRPDVIIGHPGWGETLHLREAFPEAPQILFGEYFYNSPAAELGFDAEFQPHGLDDAVRANGKNLSQALAYSHAERIVCSTPFQASTFPAMFQPRILVHHEGVDTTRARRRADARLETPSGKTLDGAKLVITFINRQFEPMRGFPTFMRALPALLEARPEAEVVLIGGSSGATYGAAAEGGSWKERMLAEVGSRLDPDRVHWLGSVPHARMIQALSVSWAHVYYTYPFVLSWSLLEAMACECLILGSDTAPVRDAVEHGVNGLLHPFLDPAALSAAMIAATAERGAFDELRRAARRTVLERFDRATVGLPRWLALIDETAASRN
jgi:glycosyltransferase involved in cell wall biosynthesis